MTPSPTLYPEECIDFPATFQDYVDLLPNYNAMLIQRVDVLGIYIYKTYESLFQAAPSFLSANAMLMTTMALLAGLCLTTQDEACYKAAVVFQALILNLMAL
jgi:hypothetical protein